MAGKGPKPVLLPNDEWVGGLFQMPGYVTDRKEPYRPYVAAWMDVASRFIVAMEVLPVGSPGSALASVLAKTLNDPANEAHGIRPRKARVGDAAAVDAVRDVLGYGVEVVAGPVPELAEAESKMDSFFRRMSGGKAAGPRDGYLGGGRIPVEVVGRFFEAAAELWKVAPWKFALDAHTLKLSVPALGRPKACVSIIGHAGQSFGIIVFDSGVDYAAYNRMAEKVMSQPRKGRIRDMGAGCLSINFDPKDRVNSTMHEEITTNGWIVPSPDGYPVAWKVDRDAVPKPLSVDDYCLATVACQATALFTKKHKKDFLVENRFPLPRTMEIVISLAGEPAPITAAVTTPYMAG